MTFPKVTVTTRIFCHLYLEAPNVRNRWALFPSNIKNWKRLVVLYFQRVSWEKAYRVTFTTLQMAQSSNLHWDLYSHWHHPFTIFCIYMDKEGWLSSPKKLWKKKWISCNDRYIIDIDSGRKSVRFRSNLELDWIKFILFSQRLI